MGLLVIMVMLMMAMLIRQWLPMTTCDRADPDDVSADNGDTENDDGEEKCQLVHDGCAFRHDKSSGGWFWVGGWVGDGLQV